MPSCWAGLDMVRPDAAPAVPERVNTAMRAAEKASRRVSTVHMRGLRELGRTVQVSTWPVPRASSLGGLCIAVKTIWPAQAAVWQREHSKSWGADGVGLGSGLTGRGWAGAETGVAGEAGGGAAAGGDDGDGGCPDRAR